MSVLAERGGGIRLVDDGDGMGHVESGRGVGPSLPVETILKWGYWRPVAQVAASWAADEPTADEAPLARKYEQVLERNAVRCRARFRRASKAVTAAGEEQNRNPQLDEILNDKQLAESATKATQAKRKQIAEEAARALALEMGISFALTNPYVRRLVQAQAGRQAERIVAGVREAVASVIEQSMDEGWSVPQTANAIYEHLHEAKGWQAVMLARTDLVAMGNGGSFAAASALAESRPVYKRWVSAEDDKVRPTHVEADKQLQPLQAPFQVGGAQLLYPGDPDGPDGEVINCFPGDVEFAAGLTELSYRSWYEGPLVHIETASGVQLSGTPNHPVLTGHGWKSLEDLDLSDKLVRAEFVEGVGTGEPEVGQVPTEAREVHRSIAEMRLVERVGSSRVDFHGDVPGGEVEIVRSHGYLGRPRGEEPGDLKLSRLEFAVRLLAVGSGGEVVGPDDRSVLSRFAHGVGHGGGESLALLERHSREAEPVRLAFASDGDLLFDQTSADSSARDAEGTSYGEFAFTADVTLDDVVNIEVVSVWAGHVFTLQTREGWYTANGIIARNCRCVIVYTDDPDKLVSSAWGQTSAAWNEADHPRDPGGEGGGEFVEKGTAGGDDDGPTEVQGGSIDEILEKMGAFEYENNPERNPGRFMKHPKSGFNVEVPGLVYPETVMHDPSGQKPPRVRDVTNGAGFAPPPGHEDAKSLGYGKYQVGEERPPDYLFRAVSEAEYQGILKNGYMQSDQRMNLSNDEGTVVAFSDPRYYLPGALASDKPGTYEGRVIRIKYRDEDGWRHDTDDYVKTSQRVPLSQIDMVTPKLTRKVTRNEGKDWNDIGDYSLSAAIWAEVAAAWDESKHPRDPGGEDGGQFITNGDDDVQAAMEKYLPTIGVPVNDDGTVTLYHAGNVDEIEREGFVKGTTGKSTGPVAVSDAAWFTPQKDKTERWSGGGTRKVLEVHVPARYVSHMPALDDSGDVEVFFEGGLRRQPDGTWAPDEQPDTFAQRLAKRRHLTSSAWAEVAAGWDESEHPREPAGSREGGRFASLAAVQAANPDAGLWAHESSGGVKLDQIKVPPELRGRGLASKALDDVLAYADQRGMPVALTIGHDPEDHGLTKGQKEQWYRGRGFVPNKGRNKDFAFTEAWIRPARGATAAAWDEGLHPRDEIGRWRDKGGGALARTPGQMVAEDVVRSSAWDESEHPRVPSGGTTSGQTAAGFDESQHPRHPKGDSKGGKFAPKGDDLFQPTVGAWDEYLDATARQDAAWDAWLVSNQERYGHLAVGMFPSNADLEAVAAKTQVQDSIAAQLEGDEDFKSLVAALDPYGDWAAEFEPGGSMPTAGTVEKQVAALATATWARTSGDTDPIALQFQIAAEREFGLDANPFVHEAFDSILRDEQDRGLAEGDAYRNREIFTDQQMSGARKFLRAQYDLTQAMFADAGITHVYGYRGMAWQPGTEPADVRGLMDARYERGHGLAAGVVAVQGNPLSSWSTSFGTSTMFASKYDIHAIVGTKIDVRRVLSTPLTGLGCLNEREMVVLGGDDMDGFTWVWNNRYLRSSADPSVQTDDVVQATPGPGWATGDRANEEEEFVTEWGDWMRRVHG